MNSGRLELYPRLDAVEGLAVRGSLYIGLYLCGNEEGGVVSKARCIGVEAGSGKLLSKCLSRASDVVR